MFNMIIGEYFLRGGLNTTESLKVFHCAPVSPTAAGHSGEMFVGVTGVQVAWKMNEAELDRLHANLSDHGQYEWPVRGVGPVYVQSQSIILVTVVA